MRTTSALVTCLALLLLGTACTNSESTTAPAGGAATAPAGSPAAAPARLGGLVPEQAVAIARKAALAKGTKLASFNEPKFAEMLIRNRRLVWAVVFKPVGSPTGDAPVAGQLTVYVDDQTGQTEFVNGK